MDADELHQRVLRQSGAWGVAQQQNDVWIGSVVSTQDLTEAVLAQPEVQRPTQLGAWNVEKLELHARECEELIEKMPPSSGEWYGPAGDPWLQSWRRVDPLLESGLAVLSADERSDDLVRSDATVQEVVRSAASSDEELLRRAAGSLAERLGIAADG